MTPRRRQWNSSLPAPSRPTLKCSRIKARNAKRQAKNFARAYGSKRAWIVAQPCAACGYSAGPCDPAHAKGEGAGFKASSAFLVPLCPARFAIEGCHRESHRGIRTFEAKWSVSLIELAADYERRWQASLSQQDPKP